MATDFTEETAADAVIESFGPDTNPRLREVLTSLVKHLHAFARDVELTIPEWEKAIDFLTRTGHKCDADRQEFILLSDVLGELDVECTRVAVTELRENTFYASISLRVNGRELEIDSRPSDALALAVRAGAPIFAADEVIAESAIEFEHEVEDTDDVVEKFKEFLDQVTPEDFAAGDS